MLKISPHQTSVWGSSMTFCFSKLNVSVDSHPRMSVFPCITHVCSTYYMHLSLISLTIWYEVYKSLNSNTIRFWSALTMVCDTQNCLVLGLCPSSGILEARNHNVSETGSVSVLRCEGKCLLCGVRWLRLVFSKAPKRVGSSLHAWGRKQIQCRKRSVF
jgi:hypothetical protein